MKLFTVTSIFFLCCCLTGCVGEEYHYVDGAELQPGPGLLSGEDGVFTLYGKTPTDQEKQAAKDDGTGEDGSSVTPDP